MTKSEPQHGTRCGGSTSSQDAAAVACAQVAGWFALRVRAGHDFRVRRRIWDHGFEAYLPIYIDEHRWSDRVAKVARPLFPGYLFVRIDPRSEAGLGYLMRLAGVIDVLPSRDRAQRIPDCEIDNVRRAAEAAVAASPCAYVVGEAVTVESGPLAGVKGVVQRTKGATRIVIGVEILRRAVSVEVDASDLKESDNA